jgi:predicted DNA-binding antitoxin AbrB/MazE fold protein
MRARVNPNLDVLMSETITATYRNGVLYPSHPLDLPDHQTVEIQFTRVEQLQVEQPNLLDYFRECAWVKIRTPEPEDDLGISDQDLASLVQTLPTSTISASQSIIEERGEW